MKPRSVINKLIYGYAAALTATLLVFRLSVPAPEHVEPYYAPVYEADAGVFTIQHDAAWRRTRNRFYATQPTCAMCNADTEVQVHHILPWHLYPDLRHTHTNLISLCQPCHFRFGHGRDWQAYNPDVGNLAVAAQRSLRNVVTRRQHEEGHNE